MSTPAGLEIEVPPEKTEAKVLSYTNKVVRLTEGGVTLAGVPEDKLEPWNSNPNDAFTS